MLQARGRPAGEGRSRDHPPRALRLSGLPHSTLAGIYVGSDFQRWQGWTLPIDLNRYGMPGCSLFVSPEVLPSTGASNGAGSLSLQIPNVAGLLGQMFFAQGVALNVAANAAGVVWSNGGLARVASY